MLNVSMGHGASIPLKYVNRHGLITGPTGTGKSVSIMRLTDELAAQGVPVFLADVKGDLSALARLPGAVRLDPYGTHGTPVKTTVAAMGPELLARCLDLSEVQAGTLKVVFAVAQSWGYPLDTISDLKAALRLCCAHCETISQQFAHVTKASIGVIQRQLIGFNAPCFGSPRFNVANLLEPGKVSILDAVKLMRTPRTYAALLMHLLTELDERLPEVGDMEKPRLVFIFDESHLLFNDVPAALLSKIERTVRLIRSKGVGVYFATQSVDDIPSIIREQLANAIIHSRNLGVGKADCCLMRDDGGTTIKVAVKIYLPTRVALEAVAPVLNAEPATVDPVKPHWTFKDRVEQLAVCLVVIGILLAAIYGVATLLGATGASLCGIALGTTLALAFKG